MESGGEVPRNILKRGVAYGLILGYSVYAIYEEACFLSYE